MSGLTIIGSATREYLSFTSLDARESAVQGHLEEWVHAFLNGPGNNKPLSDGLRLAPRRWVGPMMLPLEKLTRTCGPESGKQYRVDQAGWDTKTDSIANAVRGGTDLAPLIAEYEDKELLIRDGNHRYEGLTKAGAKAYWIIIWYTV